MDNMTKLTMHKDSCISEWKKKSNENIKKLNYLNYLNKPHPIRRKIQESPSFAQPK
jgi:hypothetical protein